MAVFSLIMAVFSTLPARTEALEGLLVYLKFLAPLSLG